MQEKFDLQLLQAVSDWQRGGDAKQNIRRGEALKQACNSLPETYRSCSLCCFRQVALPKGGIWSLIGENLLPEKISSWTVDVEVAQEFKGGVPPEGQGYQGVILCVYPQPSTIIVNLWALYQDPEFIAALERNKDLITGYHDGAGRYGIGQKEVVLEVAAVTQQEIYTMGGHSSPFDQLVLQAAEAMYGRTPTPSEYEALLLKSEHVRNEAGPKWLSLEATQRVINKMKPHAEQLSEIKRQQEGS